MYKETIQSTSTLESIQNGETCLTFLKYSSVEFKQIFLNTPIGRFCKTVGSLYHMPPNVWFYLFFGMIENIYY